MDKPSWFRLWRRGSSNFSRICFSGPGSESLGKFRLPIIAAGAAIALLGPGIAKLVEEGKADFLDMEGSTSARSSRNILLGAGTSMFFEQYGKENMSQGYGVLNKVFGFGFLILAYFEDKSRRKITSQRHSSKI